VDYSARQVCQAEHIIIYIVVPESFHRAYLKNFNCFWLSVSGGRTHEKETRGKGGRQRSIFKEPYLALLDL